MSSQFSPPPNYYPQQPAKSPGPSVGMILGIIAGVVAFAVLLIGGLGFFAYRTLWVDSKDLVVKTSNDGLTQMSVPKNWLPISGAEANPLASLQMGNKFAETYAMVLSESKSDFAQELSVNPNPDGSYSLDDYSTLIIGAMTGPGTGLTSSGFTPVTVNGMPARRYTLQGKFEGIDLYYLATILDGRNHFHQAHGWTLSSRKERNQPTLNSVLDSFQEVGL